MKLNPDSIEAQLLHLPPSERARLAELLLASLDAHGSDVLTPVEQNAVDAAWAAEADRRAAELTSGAVAGVPAADVYAELEAELRAGQTLR
jgi:putative addiction module component (TIGR02574 family)